MSFLRSIMFVGTCSDAGKSIINTAFLPNLQTRWLPPGPLQGAKYVAKFIFHSRRAGNRTGASGTG